MELVQCAGERLFTEGELRITPDEVGYRCAFIAAALRRLPNVVEARSLRSAARVRCDSMSACADPPLPYRAATLVLAPGGALVVAVLAVVVADTQLPGTLIAWRLTPEDLLIVVLWLIRLLHIRALHSACRGTSPTRRPTFRTRDTAGSRPRRPPHAGRARRGRPRSLPSPSRRPTRASTAS